MTDLTHNAELFQYPHMEGVWKEKGIIIGWNPKYYPKLFLQVGNSIKTWKEGINNG